MTNGYRGRDYYNAWEAEKIASSNFWLGFACGCAAVLIGIIGVAWVLNYW